MARSPEALGGILLHRVAMVRSLEALGGVLLHRAAMAPSPEALGGVGLLSRILEQQKNLQSTLIVVNVAAVASRASANEMRRMLSSILWEQSSLSPLNEVRWLVCTTS